jgi:VWFA-related protein
VSAISNQTFREFVKPERLVLALVLTMPILLSAQPPSFQTGITNVLVDVGVTQDGRAVIGLNGGDFIVRDEGEFRTIVSFRADRLPMDLVLLLDVSGSMARDIREMADRARVALEYIENHDRVAVVSFSVESFLLQSFTNDRKTIIAAIEKVAKRGSVDVAGPTAINRCIITSLRHLMQLPEATESSRSEIGRRVRTILIVTDNEGAPVPNEPVIRELLAADTVLHAIVVHRNHFGSRRLGPPRDDPDKPGFTNQNVFHIARATGGDAIVSTTSSQVKSALVEMLARIRARYQVWYKGPEASGGEYRRISVELSESARKRYPNATVKAREGYYAHGR